MHICSDITVYRESGHSEFYRVRARRAPRIILTCMAVGQKGARDVISPAARVYLFIGRSTSRPVPGRVCLPSLSNFFSLNFANKPASDERVVFVFYHDYIKANVELWALLCVCVLYCVT